MPSHSSVTSSASAMNHVVSLLKQATARVCASPCMCWGNVATMVWFWQGDTVEVCIFRLITALRSQHRRTAPLPGGRVNYWRVCRVSIHILTPRGMVTPITCASPALLALPSCLQSYPKFELGQSRAWGTDAKSGVMNQVYEQPHRAATLSWPKHPQTCIAAGTFRYEAVEQEAEALRRPYQALSRLLNCKPEEVALLQSATAAWTQVCCGNFFLHVSHLSALLVSADVVPVKRA